jgi:hypothetical protein
MPRYERFVNNSETTLNGAINDTTTSVTVTDASGSGYPLLGDFRILVDTEAMHVTSRSGNVLTVVRGVDGTSAASHSGGADVNVIITQEGLDAYFDHILSGASAKNPTLLRDSSGNALTSADFTFDNQGLAFVEDNPDGSITMVSEETDTSGANLHVLYKSAPAAPWTLTVGLQFGIGWDWDGSGSSTTGGIICRESGTGEFINLSASTSAPISGQTYDCFHWNSPTSFNVRIPGLLLPDCNTTWTWLQLEDDNVDLFFRVSHDGINFHQLGSDTRTDFMAAGPNQIGFSLAERAQGTAGSFTPWHEITIRSWIEE